MKLLSLRIVPACLFAMVALSWAQPAAAKVVNVSRDPYAGAIVIDADTGTTLFEKNADIAAYPASVVKLMDLLIILEKLDQGTLSISNNVKVSAEISKIGGTQVWLAQNEVFPVEDLMYAMMIRSANDAAAALAEYVAGSRDVFVELMNKRAKELGMDSTEFHSVHGLPPSQGKQPDVSTPRDLAKLARAIVARKDALVYTSTRSRTFRPGPKRVDMINHNHLLAEFEGCDGLKTGFFDAAGFSIVATAQRNGRRVIAVVMGSKDRKKRDEEAKKLLAKGFLELPPLPPPPPVITNTIATNKIPVANRSKPRQNLTWSQIGLGAGVGFLLIWAVAAFVMRRSRPKDF